MDEPKTNGQFKQTHGITAFEDRGDIALTPQRGAYLAELKAKLSTQPGREDYRVDLTAALALICEMGFSQLRQDAEQKKDIWGGGVINKLGVYVNSLSRLLDSFPPDAEKPKTILDELRGNNE
jgi:hypothetical protein